MHSMLDNAYSAALMPPSCTTTSTARLQHVTQAVTQAAQCVSHVEGEVLDSMFPTDLLQLGPLLAMQLSYLDCARNVLQGGLRQECWGHDFAQLEVTLAMSSVQGFAANQSGNGVWPLTCHMCCIRMRRVSQSDCDMGNECVCIMWGQMDSAVEHNPACKMLALMFVMEQVTGHRYMQLLPS